MQSLATTSGLASAGLVDCSFGSWTVAGETTSFISNAESVVEGITCFCASGADWGGLFGNACGADVFVGELWADSLLTWETGGCASGADNVAQRETKVLHSDFGVIWETWASDSDADCIRMQLFFGCVFVFEWATFASTEAGRWKSVLCLLNSVFGGEGESFEQECTVW